VIHAQRGADAREAIDHQADALLIMIWDKRRIFVLPQTAGGMTPSHLGGRGKYFLDAMRVVRELELVVSQQSSFTLRTGTGGTQHGLTNA
jgi:hypothetical protein